MEGTRGVAPKELRRSLARRQKLLKRVERYAAGPLARRLGAAPDTLEVRPAHHGERSLVYFVKVDGRPRVVLRAEWGFINAWQIVTNHRWLARRSLPVPRLLVGDFYLPSRVWWGFCPIVEEWVEGHHVDALGRPESAIRAVATTLARFHSFERRRWGNPWVPRLGSYRCYFLSRLERRVADLDAVLQRPRRGEFLPWLAERAAAAPLEPPFSLIHCRVFAGNFVVTPENEAVAVDLLEVRYGTFALDVAWALERVCGADAERRAWFLDTYFGLRPSFRKAFEASRQFFEADCGLARAAVCARRVQLGLAKGRRVQKWLESLRRQAKRLAALTGIDLAVIQ